MSVSYFKNRLTSEVVRAKAVGSVESSLCEYDFPGLNMPADVRRLRDGGWDLLEAESVLQWALEQYADENNWIATGRTNIKLNKWRGSDAGASVAIQVLNDLYPVESGEKEGVWSL